jgi:hypothetical protein
MIQTEPDSTKTPIKTVTLIPPTKSFQELVSTSTLNESTPILNNQQNNCGQTLLTFQDNDFAVFKYFDDMVVLNENDIWVMSRRKFIRYQNGELTQQILLPEEIVVHAIAFEISESGFWIYDQDRWPELGSEIKLLNLDLEGRLIHKYQIPKNLLMDKNGNYAENSFADIWWGSQGELYLGGIQGVYQLLSSDGDFIIKPTTGYQQGDHSYIPLNFTGSSENPIMFRINDITIPITTTSKTIVLGDSFFSWGLVAVTLDYSFVVQVEEANLPYEKLDWQAGKPALQFSLRHYSPAGKLVSNLICMTKQDANSPSNFYAVLGKDHNIYIILIDFEKKSAELRKFFP